MKNICKSLKIDIIQLIAKPADAKTMPSATNQAETNLIVQNFMGFEGDSRGIRGELSWDCWRFEGDSRGIRGGFGGECSRFVSDSCVIRE